MSEHQQEPAPSGELVHLMFNVLHRARRRFGAARFEMGAVLSTIHEHELWRGKATSFATFLEDAKINSSAGYQYMRVARVFFFGLGLTAEEIDELASVPMSLLDLAAKVVTPENAYDVLGLLTTLNERDARTAIEEMIAGMPPPEIDEGGLRLSPRVARLYAGFRDLPDDQRIEFMHRLQTPAQAPAKAEPRQG